MTMEMISSWSMRYEERECVVQLETFAVGR